MTRLPRRRWWLCAAVSGAAYHRPADTFGLVSFLTPSSLGAAACADLSVDSSGSCGRQYPFHRQYPPSSLPWPRRRRRRAIASLTVHESVVDTSPTTSNTLPIDIKSATFQELRAVSRLLVEEFYGSSLWFPAQCLVELQRLQDNFHSYEDDANRHLMLVARSQEDGSLAGFVDIDGREKKPGQTGCRPYLSDLAVAHPYRRMGVGTELVRACEAACLNWGYDNMYLKVHAGNIAAEKLYENLGYVVHAPKDQKNEVMLCCDLKERALADSGGVGDANR